MTRLPCLGWGQTERRRALNHSPAIGDQHIGLLFVPGMMSYADNEPEGEETMLASHVCVFSTSNTRCASPTSQRAQIIHTRLYLDPTAHLDH